MRQPSIAVYRTLSFAAAAAAALLVACAPEGELLETASALGSEPGLVLPASVLPTATSPVPST